jgi:hypothetical protein
MTSNNFFLVPQIIADEKYFDVSRPEILRDLRAPAGKFDRAEEHEAKDEYGVDFRVIIRLNINCQSKVPEGWTIALKLHNERVDGLEAWLLIYRPQRQGVAPNDVPLKNELDRLAALVFPSGLEEPRVFCLEYFKEPSATIADIVRQNINPVDRGDGQDGITLKVQLRLAVARLYNRQFAFENRGQEVPVAARGLEEPGVYSFRFLLH